MPEMPAATRRALLTGLIGAGGAVALAPTAARAITPDAIPGADGGVEAYLSIPDVPGESLRRDREGEIELLAWHWGLGAPEEETATRRGRRAEAMPLGIAAGTSSASPYLARAVAQSRNLGDVRLDLVRNGAEGRAVTFSRAVFRNCVATSYESLPDPASGRAIDLAELTCTAVRYRVTSYDPKTGQPVQDHEFEWDLARGA